MVDTTAVHRLVGNAVVKVTMCQTWPEARVQ
jgi:hypothetical protein